jgi:septal ring factor EnvC (AmiA/AmiB activator)
MTDTISIVLVLLTLSAVGAAGFAVLYLSKVKRNLSELGMRVLESQDIGKIKEAANKTDTFESRLAGSEQKADEGRNQLNEQKTKLNELADKLRASEEKISSFEARFNELSTKLESVEQKTSKNENDLAQTVPNIKALADEIQNLKIFQSATEKVRSQIIDAFNDMQTVMPSDEGLMAQPKIPTPEEITSEAATPEETTSEDPKAEEAIQGLEEWQKEDDPNRVSGSRRWLS